jgi:hypothetical protein
MNIDTLNVVCDTIAATMKENNVLQHEATQFNWWMIITIVEFVIILLFLFSGKKTKYDKISDIKNGVKGEGQINFDNIIISISQAEKLYKELIIKCHPDRFPLDEEKNKIATDITERIGKSRHDYKNLEALKEEAKNKLNINF